MQRKSSEPHILYPPTMKDSPKPKRSARAHTAATTGRRAIGWTTADYGPDTAVSSDLALLRARSRDAFRNSEFNTRGVRGLTTNEIGSGIKPKSCVEDTALRKIIDPLWEESQRQFDPAGIDTFYATQHLISLARNMSGECFVRRRRRPLTYGLKVPMQLEVLESDFVPHDKNEDLPNGNRIRSGIEFNRRGRRQAYWMYRSHPGESSGYSGADMLRVPASEVIHHYVPIRPGQNRGEPISTQSLFSGKNLDDYADAELTRKKSRASFTGTIKRTEPRFDDYDVLLDPLTGKPIGEEGDPLHIQGGSFVSLLPGEEVVPFEGDRVSDGYGDYMRQQLLRIAAGYNMPYEIFTGDWSQIDDRLVRTALNEFRRFIQATQDLFLIPQVCERIWGWWMDSAVFAGALYLDDYTNRREEYLAHKWSPQGWPYIHPVQDVDSKIKAIEANLTTHDAEVSKTGAASADQIVEENARHKKLVQDAERNNQIDSED